MKKFVYLSLFIMVTLSSCAGKDAKDEQNNHLNYTSKKYMFSLQFTDRWASYMAFEKTEIIDPQINIPVIYFALPTRSKEWQPLNIPAGYAELFCVRIFTKEGWKLYKEKTQSDSEIRLSDKFPGEGDKFVYMIRYPSSIPVDLYIFMKESPSITDTFKILK